MRNRFRSTAATLAVMSSLSMFAGACSDAPNADDGDSDWSGSVGSLGLSLELVPGVVVNAVDYQIVGQGFTLEGSFNVPGGLGSTFSAVISEIPAGDGHVIKLRAVAAGDAGLACAGQAPFSVSSGATTQVEVLLSCDGIDLGGSANVNGSFNICPSITSSTLLPTVQAVGSSIAIMVIARDVDMGPQPLSYAWTSSSGTLSNANTSAPTLLCTEAGPATLTYTVRDGACTKTGTFNATCRSDSLDGGADTDAGTDAAADAGSDAGSSGNPANIVINEVESNIGVPGDWIELYNKGAQAVNVGLWVVRRNNGTDSYTIPANTTIQPGAFLVLEEAQFVWDLGGVDSARIYTPGTPSPATLVDSYSWTTHAAGTYGRCPNGLGAFVDTPSTKGTTNSCASAPSEGGVDGGTDAGHDGGAAPNDGGVAPNDGGVAPNPCDGHQHRRRRHCS